MRAGSSNTVTWRSWDTDVQKGRKTKQNNLRVPRDWAHLEAGAEGRSPYSLKPLKCHTSGRMEATSPLRTVDFLLFFLICISSHYQDAHLPNTWLGSFSGAARGTFSQGISQKHIQRSKTSPAARSKEMLVPPQPPPAQLLQGSSRLAHPRLQFLFQRCYRMVLPKRSWNSTSKNHLKLQNYPELVSRTAACSCIYS